MQIRPPSTNYILVYFFSGMPGKHPDTLQVKSFFVAILSRLSSTLTGLLVLKSNTLDSRH